MKTDKKFWAGAAIALIAAMICLVFLGEDSHKSSPEHTQKVQPMASSSADKDMKPQALQTEKNAASPQNKSLAKAEVSSSSMKTNASATPPQMTDASPETDSEGEDEAPDPMDELIHERNEMFKLEAVETFPLHTVETYDPLNPEQVGPGDGEVWIRIKADNSREFKDIMAQVADLYKTVTRDDRPVTILHWVGGRPHARFQYPSAQSVSQDHGAGETTEEGSDI